MQADPQILQNHIQNKSEIGSNSSSKNSALKNNNKYIASSHLNTASNNQCQDRQFSKLQGIQVPLRSIILSQSPNPWKTNNTILNSNLRHFRILFKKRNQNFIRKKQQNNRRQDHKNCQSQSGQVEVSSTKHPHLVFIDLVAILAGSIGLGHQGFKSPIESETHVRAKETDHHVAETQTFYYGDCVFFGLDV